MQLGLAIYLICAAGIVGGTIGASAVSFSHFREEERKREEARAKEKERPLTWEPRKETRPNYVYTDDKGKERDRHSVVAVYCQRGYSKADIGWEDMRQDGLAEAVAKLMEQAEEKCAELNALEVE